MRWQENNGRMAKIQETGTIEDLYNYICSISPKFIQHCYIKRQQAKKYEEDKKLASTTNNTVAVLQMDSAENYTCTAQDEIQSAHWNRNQVTLFTIVTWVKGKVISQVVVINYMHPTRTAVVVFLDEILKYISIGVTFKNRFVMEAMKTLSEFNSPGILVQQAMGRVL